MSKEKQMLLITTIEDGSPSFHMIPRTLDCPYALVRYVPNLNIMVVESKVKITKLEQIPKIDKIGNLVKTVKPKDNGRPFEEERRNMDQFLKHILTNRVEQIELVKELASNEADFDYLNFFDEEVQKEEKKSKIIMPGK